MCYSKYLNPIISCYIYNSTTCEEEFNYILTNVKDYMMEYNDLEFIKTIDIGQLSNMERTELHVKDLNVCDGMKDIAVSVLKNDVFGRKLKFTNGVYSYHSFYSENIDVYRREKKISEPNKEYNGIDIVETGEYEYLFCLKSPENGTAELVYLGTPEESYIFAYECYPNTDCNDFISGNYSLIEDKVESTLNEDRWEYVSTLDLKNSFEL